MQSQRGSDASDTALIEIDKRGAREWLATPFWSDSVCFPCFQWELYRQQHRSVHCAFTLTLDVNGTQCKGIFTLNEFGNKNAKKSKNNKERSQNKPRTSKKIFAFLSILLDVVGLQKKKWWSNVRTFYSKRLFTQSNTIIKHSGIFMIAYLWG